MGGINDAIVQALRETRGADPIPAIKRIREITGFGLGESKCIFEYATKRKTPDPNNYNCEAVILAAILCNMQEDTIKEVQKDAQDPELLDIQRIMDILKDKSPLQVRRILEYLMSRHHI